MKSDQIMQNFTLTIGFAPAFERGCRVRIEGEVTGVATLDVYAVGLLPRSELSLSVEADRLARLRGCCSSMLTGWDPRWSQTGLDGMSIRVTFGSGQSEPQSFSMWSPPRDSSAYAMLAAALACFPIELCHGVPGSQLEIIRSYHGIQPAITRFEGSPMRVRLAPWVHKKDAPEIERVLRTIADDESLVIDLSGTERIGKALDRVLPITSLLQRKRAVRWIARQYDAEIAMSCGVAASDIDIVPFVPLSPMGEPLVNGRAIDSKELISLARTGPRIKLVSALRKAYSLPIAQAAEEAIELTAIVARYGDAATENEA